jgi:hypothetical protein
MRCKEGKIPTQFKPMHLVLITKPTEINPISETSLTNANTMGSFKKQYTCLQYIWFSSAELLGALLWLQYQGPTLA